MLNIGKLRSGGENYYLNSVARGVEDYYLGSGEAPGYWIASGASHVGLAGEVDEGGLRNVLRGAHPTSGKTLVKAAKGERVPGFDLTFRAPKSLSLLHALGPKEASNEIVNSHNAAVSAALAYLERQASGARRGKGGRRSIASRGFIGAAFRHRTSRAGDPLLHTHVLVANLIQGEDGKWGALDARHLYFQAKTAGFLYQAQLRAELTRRLGIDWTPVHKGSAEIQGIPRTVIRAFSKRRAEIEALLAERSETTRREGEIAALRSRKAKDYGISPESLLPEWRERATRLGLTPEILESTLGRALHRDPRGSEIEAIARRLAAPDGLTAQASTFSRRDALQGFCGELQHGASVEDIEAMADGFLGSDLVIPLSERAGGVTEAESGRVSEGRIGRRNEELRYSTIEMLSVEQEVIERAIERRLEGAGVVAPGAVEAALARRPTLYADQRAMVKRLMSSGLGVEVVVGKAGAGKTFALDAARDAWEASGRRVIGCALSARAAQELESGSGIRSFTIASLLADLEHPDLGGLPHDTVVVVDEAGMVGTRSLARLLGHAEIARAKVVLVGDDHQLPEIEAGGAFRGIKNRLPTIELKEVRRQPFGWERDALDLVREGRAKDALDAYTRRGRVTVAASAEQTQAQLIADWWATQDEPEPGVMIAARKSDVYDLNARARALMLSSGRLGEESLEVAGRSFARGDRVMTLRNGRYLGVINGTRAVVGRIDPVRIEIMIRRDDGSTVTLPRSYLEGGHLAHTYAITGHKAQGMTTEKALVLGDETLYREWAYVAMSRGRQSNHLYVVSGVDPERDELGGEVARVTDPAAELVRALSRSRAKDLALDVYERGEIRSMTLSEMRREWESLANSLSEVPDDPSEQLLRVRAERARLEQLIARERSIAFSIREELNAMGWVGRRRRRAEVERLERRCSDVSRTEERLLSDIARVDEDEARLRVMEEKRERWIMRNAPRIRRRHAIEQELWWREGVKSVERHRSQRSITDGALRLGSVRRGAVEERHHRDTASHQVPGLSSRDRPREKDVEGIERSLEP